MPPPSLPRGHQVLVRFSLRWGLSMVRVADSNTSHALTARETDQKDHACVHATSVYWSWQMGLAPQARR